MREKKLKPPEAASQKIFCLQNVFENYLLVLTRFIFHHFNFLRLVQVAGWNDEQWEMEVRWQQFQTMKMGKKNCARIKNDPEAASQKTFCLQNVFENYLLISFFIILPNWGNILTDRIRKKKDLKAAMVFRIGFSLCKKSISVGKSIFYF